MSSISDAVVIRCEPAASMVADTRQAAAANSPPAPIRLRRRARCEHCRCPRRTAAANAAIVHSGRKSGDSSERIKTRDAFHDPQPRGAHAARAGARHVGQQSSLEITWRDCGPRVEALTRNAATSTSLARSARGHGNGHMRGPRCPAEESSPRSRPTRSTLATSSHGFKVTTKSTACGSECSLRRTCSATLMMPILALP